MNSAPGPPFILDFWFGNSAGIVSDPICLHEDQECTIIFEFNENLRFNSPPIKNENLKWDTYLDVD